MIKNDTYNRRDQELGNCEYQLILLSHTQEYKKIK